jgi:hypothetical protein
MSLSILTLLRFIYFFKKEKNDSTNKSHIPYVKKKKKKRKLMTSFMLKRSIFKVPRS